VRTSFHHQSEAQPPNGTLTAATSPDTPSYMPSQPVRSLWVMSGLQKYVGHSRELAKRIAPKISKAVQITIVAMPINLATQAGHVVGKEVQSQYGSCGLSFTRMATMILQDRFLAVVGPACAGTPTRASKAGHRSSTASRPRAFNRPFGPFPEQITRR
jgi:hypothetical protein